jgi:hypothetical protein
MNRHDDGEIQAHLVVNELLELEQQAARSAVRSIYPDSPLAPLLLGFTLTSRVSKLELVPTATPTWLSWAGLRSHRRLRVGS